MHHIRDKKMWWAVNFCTPTVKCPDNLGFDILAPLGLALFMIGVISAFALMATDQPASLALLPIVGRSTMAKLEAFLRKTASPHVLFRAEFSEKLEDLQNQLLETYEQMKNIQAKADGEKRRLTEDEEKLLNQLSQKFEDLENEIERRKDLDAKAQRLAAGQGRKTEPSNSQNRDDGRRAPAQTRPAFESDKGKWGWNSFGEFANAVMKGSAQGATLDPRLVANAPTATSSEGVGADGGFAVPPDFRTAIMTKVIGEQSLLSRVDQLISSSNSITVPIDETTPWQDSGGIQAYWEGEGGQKGQSKVALDQATVRLNKLTVLVPVTDELLEDAPALSSYLQRKAPQKINFKVTDGIVNGTGVGRPLGLTKSSAKIAVARDTPGDVVFDDIVNMYARLFSEFRANSVWLLNQDVEPQLMKMQFPGTGTAVPAYLPPGGLSGAPFGSLMGRPVIPTEACQALGTEGDIILTDLTQYLAALKAGGIRQDVSIHLFFDYDVTAFRFVLRVGGQPWWKSTISPKNGSNTRSSIVTLAA